MTAPVMCTVLSPVHTKRVDELQTTSTRQTKLMLKIVSVAWRSVASRRNQICLILGSVDARRRHATRRHAFGVNGALDTVDMIVL